MDGFSYRGKHLSDFGEVYYIPDESERGEYALPYTVYEQEVTGHDGAYYYGNRVEAREFDLKCYYENLTQSDKEAIMQWFGRNTKGPLIFDERDWVWYDVIPNKRVEFRDYRGMTCDGLRYKGILTIHLKAYCPFGKLILDQMVNNCPRIGINAYIDISTLGEAHLDADQETLILTVDRMPGRIYDSPTATSFLVYNPGTEPTPLKIIMQGDAETGTITNETNGLVCKVNGMTTGRTTEVGKYLTIDSETGRVTLVGSIDTQLAFDMHDCGYIWIDPCIPYVREIAVSYTANNTTVTTAMGTFTREMVGQYIYIGGAWRQITGYTNDQTITVNVAPPSTGSEKTQIVTMNVVTFDGFDLDHLELSFTPRVR